MLKDMFKSFETVNTVWLIDDVEMKYMRIPKRESMAPVDAMHVPYEGEWIPFESITTGYVDREGYVRVVVNADRPITTWALPGQELQEFRKEESNEENYDSR